MSCEKHSIDLCGRANDGKCSPRCSKLRVVQRLEALTDGAMRVSFYHNTRMTGDPGSEGHMYASWMSSEADDDFGWLDDRGPDPLEVQMVKELRRLAEFYNDMATRVEDRLGAADPVAV